MDHESRLIPGLEPGGDVAVLGSGPSLTPETAEAVRGMPCLVVNHAYLRAPWAAALYASDASFWRDEPGAADFAGAKLAGQPCGDIGARILGPAREVEVQLRPGHVVHLVNSGLEAIRIAASCKPRRIFLLGFDREGGHFHDRYTSRGVAPDPQRQEIIVAAIQQLCGRLHAEGIEVLDHGDAFQGSPIEVFGMVGIGDSLHQRAVVSELAKTREIWLRTPWPQLYHDMPEIRLLPHAFHDRAIDRNSAAAASFYSTDSAPTHAVKTSITYADGGVARHGSVVAAMGAAAGAEPGTFEFPVPDAWKRAARIARAPRGRKLLVYRPLTERVAGASRTRNPDPAAYKAIFDQLRSRYFVVSVADLAPGDEWQVSLPVEPDIELHAGELALEGLVGLFAIADLVYCAPGMATVLAQAVQTPAITVFGGFETRESFAGTGSPWLPIEPRRPCGCWREDHACDKEIDVPAAVERVERFLEGLA